MAPSTSKPSRVVVSKNTRAASKKVNVAPTNARASSRPASIRQERRPSSRREESRPASRREQNRDFVIVELTSDNFPLEGKSADLVEWEPTVVELRDVEAKLKEHPECRQLLERYRTAKSSPTPVSLSMKADDLYARFENVLYEIDVLSFTAHGKVRLSWKMYPAAIAGVVDAQGPATAEEEIEELKKNLEEKEQENAILQERIDLMATENEKLEQKMKEMIEGQRMMLDQEAARYNDVEAWVRQAMAVERLNNRGAFIPELEEAVRAHQPDEQAIMSSPNHVTYPKDDKHHKINGPSSSTTVTGDGWFRTLDQLVHDTPSRRDGLSFEQENFMLHNGCDFIKHLCEHLMKEPMFAKKMRSSGYESLLSQSVMHFRRCFCHFSLKRFDIFETAAFCLIFVCKYRDVCVPTDSVREILGQQIPLVCPDEETRDIQEQVMSRLQLNISEAIERNIDVLTPHSYVLEWWQEKQNEDSFLIDMNQVLDFTDVALFLTTEVLIITNWSIQYTASFIAAACLVLTAKINDIDLQFVFSSEKRQTWISLFNEDMLARDFTPLIEKIFKDPLYVFDKVKELKHESFLTRKFTYVPVKKEQQPEEGLEDSREENQKGQCTPKDQNNPLERRLELEIPMRNTPSKETADMSFAENPVPYHPTSDSIEEVLPATRLMFGKTYIKRNRNPNYYKLKDSNPNKERQQESDVPAEPLL
uniref:CYCLIN domain-containing protein n=1 Tax=Caenorhabditis tropicalis TaxID=1561998 RepID=A0A1I7UF18_9PELO